MSSKHWCQTWFVICGPRAGNSAVCVNLRGRMCGFLRRVESWRCPCLKMFEATYFYLFIYLFYCFMSNSKQIRWDGEHLGNFLCNSISFLRPFYNTCLVKEAGNKIKEKPTFSVLRRCSAIMCCQNGLSAPWPWFSECPELYRRHETPFFFSLVFICMFGIGNI